jgi:hypothetical protein
MPRFLCVLLILAAPVAAAVADGAACPARCFLCDCAAFDRAFVPALVLSDQGNLDQTVAAVRVLDVRMAAFRIACYQDALPGTKWKADLQAVDQRIITADRAAGTDRDVAQAHKLLKEIPPFLVDMRTLAGATYYLDPLFRLGVILDQMAPLVAARTPETLAALDLATLKDLAAHAATELQAAQAAPVDAVQFGLSDADAEAVKQDLADEATDLAALRQALGAGDKRTVISSAQALTPVWRQTLRPCGDFKAVTIEAYKLQQVPTAPGL